MNCGGGMRHKMSRITIEFPTKAQNLQIDNITLVVDGEN